MNIQSKNRNKITNTEIKISFIKEDILIRLYHPSRRNIFYVNPLKGMIRKFERVEMFHSSSFEIHAFVDEILQYFRLIKIKFLKVFISILFCLTVLFVFKEHVFWQNLECCQSYALNSEYKL